MISVNLFLVTSRGAQSHDDTGKTLLIFVREKKDKTNKQTKRKKLPNKQTEGKKETNKLKERKKQTN